MGTMLRPMMAYAQTGVAPQRLLFIHRPDGTTIGTSNDARWWPSGGTTGWKASPLLSSFTDGKIASLQNNMVVLKGLSCPRNMNWLGDKHGGGFIGMLTPPLKDLGDTTLPKLPTYSPSYQLDPNTKSITASDESIDQLLLRQIPALKGSPCPIPSAQLTSSTESADRMTSIPYGGSCVRVTSYTRPPAGGPMTQGATVVPVPVALYPEASPMTAFQNYFASGLIGMTPAQSAQAAAENKSVLDFAASGLSGLQSRIPKSEISKVVGSLDAIRQLEMNLAASASMAAACVPPMFAGGPMSPIPSMVDSQTYPVWKQMKEIIKTMFLCDLTRVVSFTFGYGNSSIHFQNVLQDPELMGKYKDTNGNPINDSSGCHDISHNQGADPANAQYIIDKYHCDRTAELLAEMSTTPDIGGGTLLDNTLVVFWNECSNGNVHGAVDMPVLLFGGKFLNLKGGSYLQLGSGQTGHVANGTYSKPAPPYASDLWVTTAQAWGYPLMGYGDPSWNTGKLSGIYD
ncbi:MAG TPA: DUF1552 domain-containing protein [Polyangia bacterium]|nr:DUF1552 domain-containing protein [Polyangia bacterium]